MIINAYELNKDRSSYDDIVNAFCDKLMEKITVANKCGHRNCCFYASGIYLDGNGFVTRKFKDSAKALSFDDYSESIKSKFEKAGYKVKPTGYIGGVWQLTEDIYW